MLSLETSTPACSVALNYRGKTYSRFILESRSHTRLILPMIDAVLEEAGIGMQQLDGLAFTTGPGSFTGIRIGFGVAQGLAFGAGLDVVAVSTLEAMATGAAVSYGLEPGDYILPMLDARMDEVYWALFCISSDGRPERIVDDSLASPEAVELSIPEKVRLTVVGDGWNYAERFQLPAVPAVFPDYYPTAEAVLEIGLRQFAARKLPVEKVMPVYLRDRITWKKRQKLRN